MTERVTDGRPSMPPRLQRALESLARWRSQGIYLVGIRHHSPGCAAAVHTLLEAVGPGTVLIEGPREYAALLPVLSDARTKPPVAVLSTAQNTAAFYPLAEFSPEWVALRWGARNGAVVDFIDASYRDRGEVDGMARTLQAEQHQAHSASIAALAAKLGCRDHDEVWEHLFETQDPGRVDDWQDYLDDVAGWGALARLDYPSEVLDADDTHRREATMIAILDRYRHLTTTGDKPIVVITGAFHTVGLVEALDETAEGRRIRDTPPGDLDPTRPAWLVRFDNTRLDSLRGYGAGMPAPGFWQRRWRYQQETAGSEPLSARDLGTRLVSEVILDVVDRWRADGEPVGTATVLATIEQALGLAELRGRAVPGRTDVLDAMLSCLVRDEGGFGGSLAEAIDEVFGGRALGEVPAGTAAPPLVAEIRAEATRLRFMIDDAVSRRTSLDTYRRPQHVRRREFLARLRFVGTGFARQTGGVDLVSGAGAGQFFEEWEYAWTPLVEAALVRASGEAPTLAGLVASRVRQRLASVVEASSSAAVATLICELVVMGAREELPTALSVLRSCYDSDPDLGSVVTALHRLIDLIEDDGRLDLGEHRAAATELIMAGLAAVAYQLTMVAAVDPERYEVTCDTLVAVHGTIKRVGDLPAAEAPIAAVRRELTHLRTAADTPARLRGCLVGLAHLEGALDDQQLAAQLAAQLHVAAEPELVAEYLLGLMRSASDLLLHTPEFVELISQRLAAFDQQSFLRVLPDLRQAFTTLTPTETYRLAEQVAVLTGVRAAELDTNLSIDPRSATVAARRESLLEKGLRRDGLGSWIDGAVDRERDHDG